MSTVDKMQALNQRILDLDSELVELNRQRDSLALAYSQNDKTAIKQVAQTDHAIENASKEKSLLLSAIETLKSLAEAEQAAILDKVEEQRQTKAADFAESICDTNSAIDSKLVELRSLLELRANNLNALRALGVCDQIYLNRMSRELITAAFCSAGLHKFAEISTTLADLLTPLLAANPFLTMRASLRR
jgi:chromosome segregation ATPase